MTYLQRLDDIIYCLKTKGQVLPIEFRKSLSNEDYNNMGDMLNFLMSRCLVRLGYTTGEKPTVVVTWTKLGESKLSDKLMCEHIFEEFKTMYGDLVTE